MMVDMTRRGIVLFITLGLIFGIPYLFIKVAVAELSPEFLVLARTALAAAILLPIAARRRALAPVVRHWRPLLAFAVAEVLAPWYFLNSSERQLPSSTTGLLLASIPFVSVVVALAFGRRDRITGINAIGLLVGIAGVAAVVGLDLASTKLSSVAPLIIVVIGYAVGPAILARWMSDLDGVAVVALTMATSGVIAAVGVTTTGAWPTEVPSAPVVAAVVVLAAVCTALGFVLMFALIAEIGPIRMTAVSYMNPAVAVVAGAAVLHERITVWTVIGFALIIVGCTLVTRPNRRTPALVAAPVALTPVASAPVARTPADAAH
jgi:drug/metabolite transporter (DMT)-like permease